MNAHLNISVKTGLFHTEDDVTYTEISVPRKFNGKSLFGTLHFLFHLNVEEMLRFHMCECFVEIYSALLLSHRQERDEIQGKTNDLHNINMSAYANMKIFCHIRQSLHRFVKEFNVIVSIGGATMKLRQKFYAKEKYKMVVTVSGERFEMEHKFDK